MPNHNTNSMFTKVDWFQDREKKKYLKCILSIWYSSCSWYAFFSKLCSFADLKWKAWSVSDKTQDKFILFVIAIVFFFLIFSLLVRLSHFSSLLRAVENAFVTYSRSLIPLSSFYVHYLYRYICLHFRFCSIFQFCMFTQSFPLQLVLLCAHLAWRVKRLWSQNTIDFL